MAVINFASAGSSTNTGTSVSQPTTNVGVAAGDLLIGIIHKGNGAAFSAPSGWNVLYNFAWQTNYRTLVCWKRATGGAGADSLGTSWSGSTTYRANILSNYADTAQEAVAGPPIFTGTTSPNSVGTSSTVVLDTTGAATAVPDVTYLAVWYAPGNGGSHTFTPNGDLLYPTTGGTSSPSSGVVVGYRGSPGFTSGTLSVTNNVSPRLYFLLIGIVPALTASAPLVSAPSSMFAGFAFTRRASGILVSDPSIFTGDALHIGHPEADGDLVSGPSLVNGLAQRVWDANGTLLSGDSNFEGFVNPHDFFEVHLRSGDSDLAASTEILRKANGALESADSDISVDAEIIRKATGNLESAPSPIVGSLSSIRIVQALGVFLSSAPSAIGASLRRVVKATSDLRSGPTRFVEFVIAMVKYVPTVIGSHVELTRTIRRNLMGISQAMRSKIRRRQ